MACPIGPRRVIERAGFTLLYFTLQTSAGKVQAGMLPMRQGGDQEVEAEMTVVVRCGAMPEGMMVERVAGRGMLAPCSLQTRVHIHTREPWTHGAYLFFFAKHTPPSPTPPEDSESEEDE